MRSVLQVFRHPHGALRGRGKVLALQAARDARAGVPGLHPGLVELALQAGIAGGRFVSEVVLVCARALEGIVVLRAMFWW